MIIQVVLIAAIVAIALYALQNRHAVRLQAGKKLVLLLFIGAAAVSIIRPGLLTSVAHEVGVGRGTDLLLYLTIVVLVFIIVSTYLRFRDYEARMAKLARRLAIAEANEARSHEEANVRP